MGGSESDTPTKTTKAPATAPAGPQEQPPGSSSTAATPTTPTVYPDWSGFQAYSPIPHPGFFHTSPQAHPYMWPPPQHLLPPYGTSPAPYVMYPHGVYAHPSITPGSHPFSPYTLPSPNGNAEASGAAAGGTEVDGKSSDGKEKGPIKRSKGSLGSLNMITGKNNNEPSKTSGASANGVSQSGESGSEGSSEGSDANSQNDSQPKTSGGQDSYDGVSQNGTAAHGSQNGVTHPSSQAVLSHPMPIMPMPAAGAPAGDERELKRQRRKQSNRESARRSRLRKQAECEELAQRVEVLKEENTALRAEVDRIRKEHDQLLAQNSALKEKLGGTPRGTEDSRPERNDQHPGDVTHRLLDSNAEAEQ